MNLNKILASTCRQKILIQLSKQREATVMDLVQVLKSTYNELNRNLDILEGEGIVTQQHIDHHHVIRLNLENNKTTLLLKALKVIGPFDIAKSLSGSRFRLNNKHKAQLSQNGNISIKSKSADSGQTKKSANIVNKFG